MNSLEKQDRLRELLRTKRGPELVTALIEEIVLLNGALAELAEEVKALRTYQALSAPLFKSDRRPNLDARPERLTINAAQLFEPDRGFYKLEQDAKGRPFRWTGPGREFSFNFYIDRRRPLEMRLSVLFLVDPASQTNLTLIVDGEVFPLTLAGEQDMWIGKAEIPASTGLGATTIIISLQDVFVPKGSDRPLGIAFHELMLKPLAPSSPP